VIDATPRASPRRAAPRWHQVEFCESGRKLAAHWNVSTGMFLRRCGARAARSALGPSEP
jgi:hypothetical protein